MLRTVIRSSVRLNSTLPTVSTSGFQPTFNLSSQQILENSTIFQNSFQIQPKRIRKARTAFTPHQLSELEIRFSKQHYLTPFDRDEIAEQLGLKAAQVITWFQNRRAKMKRGQCEERFNNNTSID